MMGPLRPIKSSLIVFSADCPQQALNSFTGHCWEEFKIQEGQAWRASNVVLLQSLAPFRLSHATADEAPNRQRR
jgi:hypothetical protein